MTSITSISPQKRNITMFGLALLACTMQSRQLSLDFNITKEHVPTADLYNFATPVSDLPAQANSEVPSSNHPVVGAQALPRPALDDLARKYRPLIDRVLTRLSEAERKEVNLHFQADYRQSWICLSFANRGLAEPFVEASYAIYGVHPDKVWPRIVADRKARLDAEYYEWYDSADILRPDVPRINLPSSPGVSPEGGSASEYSGSSAPGLCSIPIPPSSTTDSNRPQERGITGDSNKERA